MTPTAGSGTAFKVPSVSVCIPTYKGAAFLGATIDSVLAQSFTDFEIQIVDDRSPDDTQRVVAHYDDPRIHYQQNALNLGPEGNWNKCLSLARGKYFKLLPHDDLLEAGCLAQQVAVLEADVAKDLSLVFGSRRVVDATGRQLFHRRLQAKSGAITATHLVRRCVRAGTNLIGEPGNGLIRTDLLRTVGGYDASFPYLVDLDYWFRVLRFGNAYYCDQPSSAFRISKGSWSVAIGNRQLADFQGFIQKFAADPVFQLTAMDCRLGELRARFNMAARALAYRVMR